jgi:hypothetical protein
MTTSNPTNPQTLASTDVANARLTQANAVLSLLAGDGEADSFARVSPRVVLDGIWAAQALIEQAQDALRSASSTRG